VSQSLAEYIGNLLLQGYSEAQVRGALAQRGYPQSMVDAAFKALDQQAMAPVSATSPFSSTTPHGVSQQGPAAPPPEAVAALVPYLRTYLTQGYQAEQLRPYLIEQGYKERDVDAAISAVTGQTVRHEVHLPGATVVKIAVLIIVAGLVFSFFYFRNATVVPMPGGSGTTPERLLDVKMTLQSSSFAPGDTVIAQTDVTNMGAGTYDVELTYQFYDAEGSLLSTKRETRAISTSLSVAEQFDVPEDAPDGEYQIRVSASYGGEKTAIATRSFGVRAESEQTPPDTETTTPPDDGTIHTPIIIVTGDELDQAVEDATAAARRGDSAGAQRLCMAIENQARRDSCLGTIVLIDRQASHCDAITSSEERDTCFMPFVLDGEYALCAKLTSAERKQLCENLKHLSGLSQNTPSTNTGPALDEYASPT
jgi:hypothetical protein